MPIARYNDEQWPMVFITWDAGVVSDADVQGLLAKLQAYCARKQRFAIVLDARQGTGVDAKHRKMMAQFVKENAADLKTYATVALVLANALQRGLVTAISWITPFPMEHRVFAEPEEGLAWCHARLEPPGLAS
jgi:hypothetical protein